MNYYGQIDLTECKRAVQDGKAKKIEKKDGTHILLNVNIVATPDSKYGDSHFVCVARTKEEREQDGKSYYIGNIKESKPAEPQDATEDDAKDLPF